MRGRGLHPLSARPTPRSLPAEASAQTVSVTLMSSSTIRTRASGAFASRDGTGLIVVLEWRRVKDCEKGKSPNGLGGCDLSCYILALLSAEPALGLPVLTRSAAKAVRVPASEVLLSPILVRPVREQLEHDRVIRLLQAKYKRKFDVAINPGNEQTAPVGPPAAPWYPDLVLQSQERGQEAGWRGRGRDRRVAEQPRSDVAVGHVLQAASAVSICTSPPPASTAPGVCVRTCRFRPPRCGRTTRSASRSVSPWSLVRARPSGRCVIANLWLRPQSPRLRPGQWLRQRPLRRDPRPFEPPTLVLPHDAVRRPLRSLESWLRRRRPRKSGEPPRGRLHVSRSPTRPQKRK